MTDNPIIKICSIHGKLTMDDCRNNGVMRSGNLSYRCKKCAKESYRKHYDNHTEEVRQKHRIYKENNYEKVLEGKRRSYWKTRAYYPKRPFNPDDVRYSDSTYEIDQEGRLKLEDWYIRELIAKQGRGKGKRNWKVHEIPQEVVDLKKEVLKIKRFMKSKSLNIPLEELLPNETNITRNEDENSTHGRGRGRDFSSRKNQHDEEK